MAYATQAQILYCLGMGAVDTDYFTAANIALAIAEADLWVDEIYDDAGATDKVNASSHYAAYLLLRNRAGGKLKGMTHAGTSGSPGKLPETSTAQYHLERALEILQGNMLNAMSPTTRYEPNDDGTW